MRLYDIVVLLTPDLSEEEAARVTADYRKILTDRQFFQSLWNSIVFSVGTAVLAIGVGGVTAWLVVRTRLRIFRRSSLSARLTSYTSPPSLAFRARPFGSPQRPPDGGDRQHPAGIQRVFVDRNDSCPTACAMRAPEYCRSIRSWRRLPASPARRRGDHSVASSFRSSNPRCCRAGCSSV